MKKGCLNITRRKFLDITGKAGAMLVISNPLRILTGLSPKSLIARNDLDVAPDILNAIGDKFKILDFAQVSDIHIVDEGNQLRAEELIVRKTIRPPIHLGLLLDRMVTTVSRDQDSWSGVGWDSIIRSINKEHGREPMTFVMATGDHTDTDLENELRWFIEIADGQISGDYQDRVEDGRIEPVYPQGLDLPWYATLGNHDVIYEGAIANEIVAPLIYSLSCSAEDLSYQDETINIYKRSDSPPWWHGFANMPEDPEDGYYSFDPSPYIHCIVLNTANYYAKDGGRIAKIGNLSLGTLNQLQFEWMKEEIEGNPDMLCLIFSHHGPRSFLNVPINVSAHKLRDTLASYKNVIAHITGHTHKNHIEAVKNGNGGGYWDISTCSIIDWPQEWRRIAIWDKGDGTGIIKCCMFQHERQDCLEIAYSDPGANHETREGKSEDRDVDLLFKIPKEVAENIGGWSGVGD